LSEFISAGLRVGIKSRQAFGDEAFFDALGNWTSFASGGATQTRTANKQNQITSISIASPPVYDANGNMTTDQGGRQFVYDAWNRLVAVKDALGNTIETFAYDALGRRTQVTLYGVMTDLYYSSAWQVLEERVNGQASAQYVWSPVYVDALVLRDRDTHGNGTLDERIWVQQDANYNVTSLLDNSGSVVERYIYDPFGKATALDAAWNPRGGSAFGWLYLFQGLRYDVAQVTYGDRARPYQPNLMRFLQNDPLGFAAGDTNLYRAEGNGPVNGLDPSGLLDPRTWLPGFARQAAENAEDRIRQAMKGSIAETARRAQDVAAAVRMLPDAMIGRAWQWANEPGQSPPEIPPGTQFGPPISDKPSWLNGYRIVFGEMFTGLPHVLPGDVDVEGINNDGDIGHYDSDGNFVYAPVGGPAFPAGLPGGVGPRLLAPGAGASMAANGGRRASQLALAKALERAQAATPKGKNYGTRLHAALKKEITALRNGELRAEVSFLNGELTTYGREDSVRVDVILGPKDKPTKIIDLKTGRGKLTPERIKEIRSHLPENWKDVPIEEMRPPTGK
jgi:RHS repeat-associated protein